MAKKGNPKKKKGLFSKAFLYLPGILALYRASCLFDLKTFCPNVEPILDAIISCGGVGSWGW